MNTSWKDFVKEAVVFNSDNTVTMQPGDTPGHVSALAKRRGFAMSAADFIKANDNLDARKFVAGRKYKLPLTTPSSAPSSHSKSFNGAFSPGFVKFLSAVQEAARARGIEIPSVVATKNTGVQCPTGR